MQERFSYLFKNIFFISVPLGLLAIYTAIVSMGRSLPDSRTLEGLLGQLTVIERHLSNFISISPPDSSSEKLQLLLEKLTFIQEKLVDRTSAPETSIPTVAEIGAILEKYRTLGTKVERDPAVSFLDFVRAAFDVTRPVPKFDMVAERVAKFLGDMIYETGKTGVNELTKAVICHLWPESCSRSANVNVTLTVENSRNSSTSIPSGSLLDIYTSVWYPVSDSADDMGEVERTVVPRLIRQIGGRTGCVIFVDGNADTVGSDSHNIALSERRARAVEKVLSARFDRLARVERFASSERNGMKITRDDKPEMYNRRTDIHLSCG